MDSVTFLEIVGSIASIIGVIITFGIFSSRIRVFIANPTVFLKGIRFEIRVCGDNTWFEEFLRKFAAPYNEKYGKYRIRYGGTAYFVEYHTTEEINEHILYGPLISEDLLGNRDENILILTANFEETYLRFKYRHLKKELVELSKEWYELAYKVKSLQKVKNIKAMFIFEVTTFKGTLPNRVWDIRKDLKIQIVNNKIRIDLSNIERIREIPKYIVKSFHSIKFSGNL